MGAATEPPVAASDRSPPSSTMTAMAIFGFSAGAKAIYQACGGVLRGTQPCSAVPASAADVYPVRPLPVESSSDSLTTLVTRQAASALAAWPTETGLVSES